MSSLQHSLGDAVTLCQYWSWFGSRLTNLNTGSVGHVNVSQTPVKVIGRQEAQTAVQPTS